MLSRKKGNEIESCLLGGTADPHFKFCVKNRGFKLMDYPILSLNNVLCFTMKKVQLLYIIFYMLDTKTRVTIMCSEIRRL